MGIDQSKGAMIMSVFGALELISRLVMCFLGDYIKGRILFSYVGFCLSLSILNFVAAKASTFQHMLTYSVCKLTNIRKMVKYSLLSVFNHIVFGVLAGLIRASMYSSCSEVLLGRHVALIFTIFRVAQGISLLAGSFIAGQYYCYP